MKILIIGSKGFIGSNIFTYLAANKDNVVYCCDVVTDYIATNYFTIDASSANYQEIFEAIEVDVCINCSGAASVPDSFEHPYRDFLLNTSNVYAILDAIKKNRPACRFINLSSAAVYGNPQQLPVSEDSALSPLSPYAFHKLEAEQVCSEFYRFFGIQTCSLRIFSAYGNGLKKQLFWDLAKKIRSNTDLSLFGTGNESRDFIHVADIVRVAELIISKGSFDASVYNVANGEEFYIKDVVALFCKLSGWAGNISFAQKERAGDPVNWCADISSIRKLGYKQTIQLEEGLKQYIKWVKELN